MIDLVEAVENKDIVVLDVLEGLKYAMEYRIKGGKMLHLDASLMKRLCQGFLKHMAHLQGNLLTQRPTIEADMAFELFGDFTAEVTEFRDAVGQYSASDLRHSMKLHRRCQPRSSQEQREAAATLLGVLTRNFPQFADWHDLVKEDEHDDVEQLIKDFPDKFGSPVAASPSESLMLPPQVLYFDKNAERLAEMYGSSTTVGLSSEQVGRFRAYYGENRLPTPPKPSVLHMIWTQLTDFMIIILVIAAIAEMVVGDPKAAAVLLFVVVLNTIIGVAQEFKASQALEALMSLSVPKATVVRDGVQSIIDSHDLVPGDLVLLEEGCLIPADLRLCESAQLELVEVILTGEALPVAKSIRTIRKRTRRLPLGDCKGNAFMATTVARGRGKGIVTRTGVNTEIGKISAAISSTPATKSSIERKLASLGKLLVFIALLLCVIIVVIGIAYKRPVMEVVFVGISLAVSVIPEGLVAVVTVSMALGVRRMAKRNAIVRKLPSVETLGSLTVICSDKTGTLTEGKMGAQAIWTSDDLHYKLTHSTKIDPNIGAVHQVKADATPSVPAPTALPSSSAKSDSVALQIIKTKDVASPETELGSSTVVPKDADAMPPHLFASMTIAALCNNASIVPDTEKGSGWKPIGDPTEIALVVASKKAGVSREWLHDSVGLNKLGEYAFDSDRKMMSVVYTQEAASTKSKFSEGASFVFAKGAPESVLVHCKSYLAPPSGSNSLKSFDFVEKGKLMPLDDSFVEKTSLESSRMASSGLRVLAFAMKRLPSKEEANKIVKANSFKASESDLVFIGLIGLIDPPKEGVKESVAICKRAGINVIMITGDHMATATAIAKQLGIFDETDPEKSRTMKGYEIDLISEAQLAEQKPFPVVFARVSPDNKLKIVKALQSKQHMVGMTGDGVNDAPAIKKADVGVAMGISGTEITKQAADIVLADDNFSTIVDAVKEGRQVFDNIKKFIVYLLSCNSAEIFLFLFAAVANRDTPFTTIQILWANIIADIPPAMSLGLEPPEVNIMERKPRPTDEGVLTLRSSMIILSQGLAQSILTFAVFMMMESIQFADEVSLDGQRSTAFMLLTTMQLTQSLLSRSVEESVFTTGITGNKYLIWAFLFSFACSVIGLLAPGISEWLEFVPISNWAWLTILVCVVIQIIWVELTKFVARAVRDAK